MINTELTELEKVKQIRHDFNKILYALESIATDSKSEINPADRQFISAEVRRLLSTFTKSV